MAPNSPPDAPSPCIAVCILDPETELCRGCYRTLAEIGGWMTMSHAQRLEVLAAVAERRQRYKAAEAEARRQAARQARRAGRRRPSPRHR